MYQHFSAGISNANGVKIDYVIGGEGPAVLLLHGFPQTKAMWAKVAVNLAKSFTVVCADLRGYGDSEKPENTPDNAPYSFRSMAKDQKELMAELGYDTFHLVGHDRGARTAHRLVLDFPKAVKTLTLMDIVPTWPMFMETNRHIASAYWHWYFLSQPAPFPEKVIGADPDHFYEACLLGWGGASLADFDPEMLAAYRKSWHDPGAIRGGCNDYRAAATIDLEHDKADLGQKISCPCLIMYGANGAMARLFDVPQTWKSRCDDMHQSAIEGGHFFVDEKPDLVASELAGFFNAHDQGE